MNPHTDTGEKCHHTISGSYHDCGGSTYTAAVSVLLIVLRNILKIDNR